LRAVHRSITEGLLGLGDIHMRKVEEIERQIRNLSRDEFAELRDWFLEQDWQSWDAQIAADAQAGKLDELAGDAIAEHKAGRAREV
jgi:hypothetical protein